MFELSIAKKYLIPRRRQLSASLIAVLSIAVISLVVWLVILFLSVTEGIERNWLDKLTAINSPLRLTPTEAYYDSYYYQVDRISSESDYSLKSIAEKQRSSMTDPYQPDFDYQLPASWYETDRDDQGNVKDLVKLAYSSIDDLKRTAPDAKSQAFETSGALMRLKLTRPIGDSVHHQHLSQVSYLCSFPEQNPHLDQLILSPTLPDLKHLLKLAQRGELPDHEQTALLQNIEINEVVPAENRFELPRDFLPENTPIHAQAIEKNDEITHFVILPYPRNQMNRSLDRYAENQPIGELVRNEDKLYFECSGKRVEVPESVVLIPREQPRFKVTEKIKPHNLLTTLPLQSACQKSVIKGLLRLKETEIVKGKAINQFEEENPSLPWCYRIKNEGRWHLPEQNERGYPVLIAKSFRDQGVLIGDSGTLSFPASSASMQSEQRLPIYVSGFYDPGVISIGPKCILVPEELSRAADNSLSCYTLDKTQSTGIFIWYKDLSKTDALKAQLEKSLKDRGIDRYWKVTSYKQYDFAKDILQQFQSDKYLFTIIGMIILLVACSNISSLLILLVNDKKREIAILQSLGASKRSIASIFGACGMALGVFSSLVGITAAYFTLGNLDKLIRLLSFMQGHDLFNAAFYGSTLPKTMSHGSLLFIAIVVPVLSLLAGLIPALKAVRIDPAVTLRSE